MLEPTITFTDALAEHAHRGVFDKAGELYIEHPRAVAAALEPHGKHALMAGLLHDVVEDTPITLETLRTLGYPEEVVRAVDSVTRRPGETYMDMIRRAAADPLGCLVKMADNRHNFGRLDHLTADEAAFLYGRYGRAYEILERAHQERQVVAAHRARLAARAARVTRDQAGQPPLTSP